MVALSEKLFPVPEAVEKVTGEKPCYPTLFRWMNDGLKTPTDSRVYLEFVKIGSKRRTSLEAVRRFIEATTLAAGGGEHVPVQTRRARAAAVAAAERELEAAGL